MLSLHSADRQNNFGSVVERDIGTRSEIGVCYIYLLHHRFYCSSSTRTRYSTLSDLLDKPWSQVSSLLPPPRYLPSMLSRIGVQHFHFSAFLRSSTLNPIIPQSNNVALVETTNKERGKTNTGPRKTRWEARVRAPGHGHGHATLQILLRETIRSNHNQIRSTASKN